MSETTDGGMDRWMMLLCKLILGLLAAVILSAMIMGFLPPHAQSVMVRALSVLTIALMASGTLLILVHVLTSQHPLYEFWLLGGAAVCIGLFVLPMLYGPKAVLARQAVELKGRPGERALRESVIRTALQLSPAPEVPAEARELESRAQNTLKGAKTEADALAAAQLFGQSLLLAPWAAGGYAGQAAAWERAGRLKESKESLEFYLLAAPLAEDGETVRKRIALIDDKIRKRGDRP